MQTFAEAVCRLATRTYPREIQVIKTVSFSCPS